MQNRLYFGDNLEVLRDHVKDESVDLVYLDPPFNSNASYNVFFGGQSGAVAEAQAEAFRDTWKWGEVSRDAYDEVMQSGDAVSLVMGGLRKWLGQSAMMAYLTMMAVRLVELRRVLKPRGSLYLHCDPTASHYLKVIMDAVFEPSNFVAEIVWRRTNARGTKERWPRLHDVILHYSKTNDFAFNAVLAKAEKSKLPHTLITGPDGQKYQTFELTGAGITKEGESGRAWRGHNPTTLGRHWGNSHNQLEEWNAAGLIHWPKEGGFPRRRAEEPFDPNERTVVVGDVWNDIDRINQTAKERVGYPTQKPIALLERIIAASSKPGDVVLDPFCGCGTSVDAAEGMGRRWIGIDVTHYAITLVEERLKRRHAKANFSVHGRPAAYTDAVALAARDKHQFQWWAAWFVGAQAYREERKTSDRGIDGSATFANGPFGHGRLIISVKGGDNVGVQMVRDLRGVIEREEAEMGILVTLVEPTQPMRQEALQAGLVPKSAHGKLPRLQIATIAELFDGREPKLPPMPAALSGMRTPTRRRRKQQPDNQLTLMLPLLGAKTMRSGSDFVDPRYLTFGVSSDGEAGRLLPQRRRRLRGAGDS